MSQGDPLGNMVGNMSFDGGATGGYYPDAADWDDSGAAAHGLTAKAEAAGFSPVRFNKARQHSLDVDPRTKLKIIDLPAERRVAFAAFEDVVLHVFVDCFKITTNDEHADRVAILTDQSFLLCTKEGTVSRCFMVDRIKALFVSNDHKALGIQVPSEYDVLLKFQNPTDRDKVIKVLRTVFRRLTHNRLPVTMMKKGRKFDPSAFNIKKPQSFRPMLIPQRTREQLRQALEVFEQEEEAMLEELDMIQDEMEAKHRTQMSDFQAQLEESLQRLKEVVREVWDNETKLSKLREDVSKGRRLIEQVDGPFSSDGDLPLSKDAQIAELELVVARLNASVYASGSEQMRRNQGDQPGATYFQRDLQEQLYNPAWPGDSGRAVDLASLQKILTDKIAHVNEEIRLAQEALEQGRAAEARLQSAEERIAYLRHLQRSRGFGSDAVSRAGGLVGSALASPTGKRNATESKAQLMDDTYGWLADLPQEITVETITVDPRTGLHFVDVPDVMRQHFSDIVSAVIHFFAVVKKPSKMGELTKRVLILGDQALYLCTPNGVVKRCVDCVDIDEILIDSGFGIGFKCSSDYDLTFTCITAEHRQEIIDILQRIYKYASGGRAIPVSEVPRHQRMEGFLRLQPPAGYVMQLTPFRSRQELVDAIREKRDVVLHNAPVTVSAASATIPADLKIPEEQYLALRADVARQMEYEWRQDSALVQLRAQIDNMDKQLRATNDEAHHLKRQIDSHRCEDGIGMHAGTLPLAPGGGIMPTSGPGTYKPYADGLFFINVEPEQLNCELDVLRVTFNEEFLFTGHTNGFVNIWDLSESGHPLLRSLREHTGRITDVHATQLDLLTSSTDSSVRRWDLTNGRCTSILLGHRGPVNAICHHENRVVSGGGDTFIHVWDLERATTISALRGHRAAIVDLKFEGHMLVSCEWGWTLFWDIRSGKVVRSLRDEYGGIKCLDYSDGIAACGGCGGDITIWDVWKGTGETISGHDDDINCVQLAGKSLVTAAGDYKIKMWDVSAMKSQGTFYESHPFETMSFHMEGKRFAAAQGQFVKLWSK